MPGGRGYPGPVNLSQKVAVNTTLLVLGRLAVAGSGLAGVAVSTRYLGRGDFGKLTVAIVFVSVFGFFTDAGLYTVAARELAKHPENGRRLLDNVFSIGVVMSAVAVVLAFAVMAVAYGGGDEHLIRLGIAILAVQMLASPIGGTAAAYLVAHQRAAPMALAATLASVLFLAGLFVVVQADLGFTGLAACFAATGLVTLLLPVLALRGQRLGFAFDRGLWTQMLRWAVAQGGVLVLGVIYFRVDTFLLSFVSSDGEVGRYAVAYRVLEVLTVVPAYLMSTLFPEIARQQPHSARLNEIVQGALSSVWLAVVPLVIIFVAFAAEVVAVAGGPAYADSASVLRVLIVAVALLFVNTVFFQSLVALNRQRNLFLLLLGVLAGNVVLNLLLIPPLGAMGAAISLLATEGVVLVLVLRIFATVGTVPRLRRPLRLLAAAVVAAGAALALRELVPFDRSAAGLDASFTGALGPLATLVGASVLTAGLWAGALTLFGAVPSEVRAAFAALRQRSEPEPVAVLPQVGE